MFKGCLKLENVLYDRYNSSIRDALNKKVKKVYNFK